MKQVFHRFGEIFDGNSLKTFSGKLADNFFLKVLKLSSWNSCKMDEREQYLNVFSAVN